MILKLNKEKSIFPRAVAYAMSQHNDFYLPAIYTSELAAELKVRYRTGIFHPDSPVLEQAMSYARAQLGA